MTKILVIEDNRLLLEEMQTAFQKWNYQMGRIQHWDQVDDEVRRQQPDLVIMDITLPSYDGFYWTQKIREFSNVPLIFVSAAEMDPNAVRAIASGADDYIVKPFASEVLISKIQALLRRTQPQLTTQLRFENYQLNVLTNVVTQGAHQVKLTPTEGLILKVFFMHPQQIITKKQLLQQIWQSGEFLDAAVLNVNMSRLRSKVATVGTLKEQLVTVRKRGYQLISHANNY
ncbi:MAG: response regulator transcription factor [Bombilactobacillus mellifer]|uniref:response regulator transcription factor n=1 Tax=Bombilactobacillus mellifer TaxID=1218492 RepID=UPI0023FA278D|nr:response regulator transcription factor [Bombilactobacillus mellifer]MCT6894194.1 response regulator transcription factor [Bombilactobacillus mellifer]